MNRKVNNYFYNIKYIKYIKYIINNNNILKKYDYYNIKWIKNK